MIVRELEQIGSHTVFFVDDNALVDPSLMEELRIQIKKSGINKQYWAQIRADSVVRYRSLLAGWKSIGLENVFIGFESITQKGLDELGKRLEVKYITEAIKTLDELGISIIGSFIVNPDFDKEDFSSLRRFVRRMRMPVPLFTVLTPLPGTVLYEEKLNEITSHNFELYDLMHSVLPTRLELINFYKEYGRLVNLDYFREISPGRLIKQLKARGIRLFLKDSWAMLRMMKDNSPGTLVRHHLLPAGKLTEECFPEQ